MRFPVDLSLFEGLQHSPSYFSLQRSMGRGDLTLHDFCIPVNPYFPPPETFARFRERLETILKYYPSPSEELAEILSETLHFDPATMVLANGSTELICWITQLLATNSLATTVPTFGQWTDYPEAMGRKVHLLQRRREVDFELDVEEFARFVRATGARAVALCNPNNPTGALIPKAEACFLLDALADLDVIVIDESFIEFAGVEIPTLVEEAVQRDNVIVIKSLGKNFGLHGIRAGYAVTNRRWAELLLRALPRWNVNAMAEALILELRDLWPEYEASRRRVMRDANYLQARLRSLSDLEVFPSRANFSYCRIPEWIDAIEVRNRLLTEHGCLVRECGNKLGSDSRYFRIAARPKSQIDLLIDAWQSTTAACGLALPSPLGGEGLGVRGMHCIS